MKYVVTLNGKEHVVDLPKPGAGTFVTAVLDGKEHKLDAAYLTSGTVSMLINGQNYDVDFERPAESQDGLDPRLNVRVHGHVFKMEVVEERRKLLQAAATRGAKGDGPAQILSPMPGKLVKFLKAVGDQVKAGEGVAVVEAMKMENELKAPSPGVIAELRGKEGQAVDAGAVLVVIGPLPV